MTNDLIALLQNVNLPTNLDLTAFARQIPDPAEFTLKGIFPERTINGIRYRLPASGARTISVAKFRAYDAQTPIGQRSASRTYKEGMLPPLGQKTNVGELETILLAMARGADAADLVDAMYDEDMNNVLAIRARMELARGDLLNDNKFSLALSENGLLLDADFGIASGHAPTASTLWSDAADSTPLTDELAWHQKIIDDSGQVPTGRLASQTVINLLQHSVEYLQNFYRGMNLSTVPGVLTPAQVQSVRDQWGLPPIQPYDTMVDVDGTTTRVFPDTKFVLYVPGLGETQFGTTAESIVLSTQGNPRLDRTDAPGIVVTRAVNDDPVAVWVRANAIGMPLLFDNTRILTATVR
jgi:hypothetical protein